MMGESGISPWQEFLGARTLTGRAEPYQIEAASLTWTLVPFALGHMIGTGVFEGWGEINEVRGRERQGC